WHQHQPLYYQDADGIYTRPWVRVHATKDYLDMAQKVAQYPDVHVTFNITPSLIRQINDLAEGAKDIYWVLAEKEVSELTTDEKQFILERFFDANWTNIIALYPRYQELLDKRGGTSEEAIQAALTNFTDQDFLGLQVWFNLAWFDPTYLAEEPLLALVEKGENFEQADKQIVFDRALEIIQEVLPYHAELQREGQIEVTTTPYAHPILPLIYNNQLALVGNPSAEMPEKTFAYPEDAVAHLDLSVEMYEENFGTSVRGLWPGEGAVAEEIIPLVAEAGYTFMQTGEPVLAKSLGIDSFTRDSEGYVQEADLLYRPYYVTDDDGNQVAMFFRDWTLSDKIGFDYSEMSGEAAAQDLVGHLEQIQADFLESGTAGPHIVSIILDGENAWENYAGDGNDFFNALYQQLSDSEVLQTVTPSEYLEMFPEQQTLDYLFPGAWFSANYDTWIGEEEEAIAWDYLATTREDLAAYESGAEYTAEENLAQAFDFMYLAEGSDWFWWYGADQDSGQDSYFDEGYRALLAGVYDSLGVEVPAFVSVPIVQAAAVQPEVAFTGLSTPEMMAAVEDPAWETAAYYPVAGESAVSGFYITMDEDNLYLRVDSTANISDQQIGFYFSAPNVEGGKTAFALDSEMVLQFFANSLLQWDGSAGTLDLYSLTDSAWTLSQAGVGTAAAGEGLAEFKIPLESLGGLNVGTYLKFGVVVGPEQDVFPTGGPARMLIPSLGETTMILEVQDPVGDDDGPGSYLYPTDGVFADSVFDVDRFSVGSDGINLVFTFDFVGPVANSWNSSNGLSVQTLDVYIDTDPGEGTGARILMPGRNAALEEGNGWEYAIWAEGWTPQVVMVDPDTLEPKQYTEATGGMTVVVDTANNQVVVRVPLSYLPEGDPADWGYAAAVLGQEGYPTEGVWRVRDVSTYPAQYLFGGGTADSNHTRIIDLILAEGQMPNQEEWLANYPSITGSIDAMTADDFDQIPLLIP
ncbi:MAG: glycoside hydrolase, partial [Anaerolineaceae bacterium]|nr:glycoside hydrolase [Anaerolineaceae bacterium]